MSLPRQTPRLLSRALSWQNEITDAFTLYSVSALACAATFYSPLFDEFVTLARDEGGVLGAKFTIVLLFLGAASSVFGQRRLAAERQASSISLRDPVTLLPNRRALENELDAAAARGERDLTVLLVALERLAVLNNLHGHAGADAVLSQVAARLRRETEPSDSWRASPTTNLPSSCRMRTPIARPASRSA